MMNGTLRKHKLEMGQAVGVRATLKKVFHERQELKNVRGGCIVGCRSLPEGKVEPCWGEEPASFLQTGTVQCLAIVFWPTLNPVYVLFDDIVTEGSPAFWPPNGSAKERRAMAEVYRKYTHQFPRDAMGRFK